MSEEKQITEGAKTLADIGKMLGMMAALFVAIGFFAKPFVSDFIEDAIEAHEEKLKEESLSKVKLRKLLAEKMGVDEDEVHIELGRMYIVGAREILLLHDSITSIDKRLTNEIDGINRYLDETH